MQFNEAQLKAVSHLFGPAMVIAGPGSGKTMVITRRIQKLIKEYYVNPSDILVVTFTKAAAIEMENRFTSLNRGVKYPVNFGTFHSVFYKIIKYAYNYNAENILKQEEKYTYLKEIIYASDLDISDEKDILNDIISEISAFKSSLEDITTYKGKHLDTEKFKELFQKYKGKLEATRKVDFDDMVIMCYKLLSERADILEIWQEKFKYIMVDEFQDINKIQYEIVKMLVKPHNNIFIVGDDDQSIYGFRGSKPEIMHEFEKDFRDTVKIVMDINYRSVKGIVSVSEKIIANNRLRFEKVIKSEKDGDEIPIIKSHNDIKTQNEEIIKTIKEFRDKGCSLSEMAILYRVNLSSIDMMERLIQNNIGFRSREKTPCLYDHWAFDDIISYIKFALGNKSRKNFLKIMNRPVRYISREILNDETINFTVLKKAYGYKYNMIDRIEKLEYDLKFIKGLNPFSAMNYIRNGVGYNDFLNEYSVSKKFEVSEVFERLDLIQEKAKEFDNFFDWFKHFENFKKIIKEQDNEFGDGEDCLEILTMHGAKGLEFKTVFIPDVNDGLIPYKKAVTDEEIEEERRLFYVAVTRAKEELIMSFVKERQGKDQLPSRFLEEIKKKD